MLTKFKDTFHALPKRNQAMVYLMWIYQIGFVVWWLFINIYVFQLQQSIADLIVYNSVFMTAICFSLLGFWWWVSSKKKDIKKLYYVSYGLFIVGFLLLLILPKITFVTLLFAVVFGSWLGAFWCTLLTHELAFIKDEDRDFYSSSIYAGKNVISVAMPLVVTWVFFVWWKLWVDGYMVLFFLLPFVYMTSFWFIKDIDVFVPQKVSLSSWKETLLSKKYMFSNLYFLVSGPRFTVMPIFVALTSIVFLKSEVNIWLFQGLLWLVSVGFIIFLSHKRHKDNRLLYLAVITLFMIWNFVLFVFNFSLWGYVIYNLILILIQPTYKVSLHVYNLKLMDNLDTWFFPTMLLRELLLWIGRILSLLFLLGVVLFFELDTRYFLYVVMGVLLMMYIFVYVTIYLFEKRES